MELDLPVTAAVRPGDDHGRPGATVRSQTVTFGRPVPSWDHGMARPVCWVGDERADLGADDELAARDARP